MYHSYFPTAIILLSRNSDHAILATTATENLRPRQRGWCKSWTLDSGLDCGLDSWTEIWTGFWTGAVYCNDHFQPTSLGSTEWKSVNVLLLLEHWVRVVSGLLYRNRKQDACFLMKSRWDQEISMQCVYHQAAWIHDVDCHGLSVLLKLSGLPQLVWNSWT